MNKKIIIPISILAIVASFALGLFIGRNTVEYIACGPSITDSATFYAEIISVNEKYFHVKGLEINDINNRGEFTFSIDENVELLWRGTEINISDFKKGDKISIMHNGIVMESYPAQLSKVYKVILLEDEIRKEVVPDWGVDINVKDVLKSGLKLEITEIDGTQSGNLMTGSFYVLEKYENNQWEKLDYILPEDTVAWESIGYNITKDKVLTLDVDWTWLYGELSEGKYRIGKEIMDFKSQNNSDTAIFYAAFEIKNE